MALRASSPPPGVQPTPGAVGWVSSPPRAQQADTQLSPEQPLGAAAVRGGAVEVGRRFEVVLAILSYSACSVGMILLNKLVIARHNVNFPLTLLFFQNFAALLIVLLMRRLGLVDFPGLDAGLCRRWVPLTLLFICMLTTSLLSLRTMSVPIQTLIKNLAIVLTALGDHSFFGHELTPLVWVSFLLMIAGSALGAGTDAWVTAWGLFWSFSNAGFTSTYQLYMKGVLNDIKKTMGRWGPVYYNNMISLPFLVIPAVLAAPGSTGWIEAMAASSTWARVWLACMMVFAAAMTMSSFWCMRCTSPTTYGVVGGMNKVPLAVLGMVIFEQYPDSFGATGIVMALSGGLLYTYASAVAPQAPPAAVSAQPHRAPRDRASLEAPALQEGPRKGLSPTFAATAGHTNL